jgi:hypothetical protein
MYDCKIHNTKYQWKGENAHQFAVMEEERVEHIKEAVQEGPQVVRPRALQHSAQHAQRARLLLRFRRRAKILRDEGQDQGEDCLLTGPGQQPASANHSVHSGIKWNCSDLECRDYRKNMLY